MSAAEHAQVLEFKLGDDRYCVDIQHVAEIVDIGKMTPVPNAPPYVEGVMDLRGRTTSIIDPTVIFDIASANEPRRIVVFDPESVGNGGAVGWLVEEVDQVLQAPEDDLDDAPVEEDTGIKGVLKRDDDFAVWVDPTVVEDDE